MPLASATPMMVIATTVPNIVDPVGKDILEVNRVMEMGYLKEDNPCSGGAGREDVIENRLDQKCGNALGGPYHDHQADRR